MPDRPLTVRQQQALRLAVSYGVVHSIKGSMPSLERRGLMERYWLCEHGRRYRLWRPTAAGVTEAQKIRAAAKEPLKP